MDRLRILTWHVHGSYLEYLARTGHDFFVPVREGRPPGYGGRPRGADPAAVHEVPADRVRDLDLDVVLFQSARNWLVDQYELLTPSQLALPRIYLEHDPPREHPTDTRHVVDDRDVLLVHVTAFNALMWDAGRTPTRVIEHGVTVPEGLQATHELERGIVVVNDMASRGRRLGLDLFQAVRGAVPLDLVGMNAEALGGLGEIPHDELPPFLARYRLFFHPIRYTSLGLAVCEAMMLGLPIVALATTEMPTVVRDGVSGFVSTDPGRLVAGIQTLLSDRALAREMGAEARRTALERFDIRRFARDWTRAFADVGAGARRRSAPGVGAAPRRCSRRRAGAERTQAGALP
jgi:hypothetical protein